MQEKSFEVWTYKMILICNWFGGLWCLTPLSTIFQLQMYIVVVSFIDGGNRSTRRKSTTCRKSLTTLSHNVVSSTPCHERASNSQLQWWYALIAHVVVNPTTIRSRPRRLLLICNYSRYLIWKVSEWLLLNDNNELFSRNIITGTCFIQKIYAPFSSFFQGKHLPFTPSPLRLNIFRLFVILSLTQLYRYTPEIFLFSTATFKYKYRAPLRRIGQEYSAKVAFLFFSHWKST